MASSFGGSAGFSRSRSTGAALCTGDGPGSSGGGVPHTTLTWGAPPKESAAARFNPANTAGLFSMARVNSLSVHRVRLPFFHTPVTFCPLLK